MFFFVVFAIIILAVTASLAYTSRPNHEDGTKDAMDALRAMHDHSAITRSQMIR